MSSIFTFATGASTLANKDDLIKFENRETLAFGHAFRFFIDHMKWYPTYWTFVDAHSTLHSLQYLVNKKIKVRTKLLLLGDVTHKSLKLFRKHGFGKPQKSAGWDFTKDGYKKYLKLLEQASKYITIQNIPTTSYVEKYGSNIDDYSKRCQQLLQDKSRVGLMHVSGLKIYDKLHVAVLPLCFYLKHKDIYMIGFDGRKGRFLDGGKVLKKKRQNDNPLVRSYNFTAPLWKKWAKEMGRNLYSMGTREHTVLAEHFPYVSPNDAYERSTPFLSKENLKKIINGSQDSN